MAYRIKLHEVKSSNLYAVGYDAAKRILAVQFRDASIWHYAGVPADHVEELLSAESIGRFYTQTIKGKYQAEKMTGDCPKCGDSGYIGETCLECGCDKYAGPILHSLVWDHPAAASKRDKPAKCGRYVKPSEIANGLENVTCSECLAIINDQDAMSVDESDDLRRG